ncbi:uracil-DNA glycosylase family protein [Campylobacter sp.]|uniref:uracil-DNA glycosylase family protein n=1 Tax=Campylobacter sp. TaxID=205 RepID=UPI0025C2354F|nr:uracil-DNA glycosylase family protein [Campylobacter sp.]
MDKRNLYYLKAFGFEYLEEVKRVKSADFSFVELQNSIKKCTLCNFYKLRKNSLIEKEIKKARILIFQSYIDKDENESGKFFASKLKQDFLLKFKELLDLNEDEIYFSYVLKCFSNFKFDKNSVEFCLPYFYNELKFIKPKLILCLGEEAFLSLGFADFKTYIGQWLKFNESLIMPNYDLNYLSKNPSLYANFIEDIKKIKGYV